MSVSCLIVATDIFGRTQAAVNLSKSLGADVLLSPYADDRCFDSESEAYSAFVGHGGVPAYVQRLQEVVGAEQAVCLVGFSAGASAIWQLAASDTAACVNISIGFYASQIRHQLDLQPRCDTRLIMPRIEPHFDVRQVTSILVSKPSLRVYTSQYHHGFMNQHSTNYHPKGYELYLQHIQDMLSNACG